MKVEYSLMFGGNQSTVDRTLIVNYYTTLLSKLFIWDGIEDDDKIDIKVEMLEQYLHTTGTIIFFKLGGIVSALPVVGSGWDWDGHLHKGKPYPRYLPTGELNGKLSPLDMDVLTNEVDCVIGRSNMFGLPSLHWFQSIIKHLQDSLTDLKVNRKQVKFGNKTLLKVAKDSIKTVTSQMKKWTEDENSFGLLTSEAFEDMLKNIIQLKVDDRNENIWTDIEKTLNFINIFLGIPHPDNTGGKERKITDQMNLTTVQSKLIMEDMLNMRQRIAEQVNTLFGTKISVSLAIDLDAETTAGNGETITGKGDTENVK